MCGGALEINNNETVVTCEYCGNQQTLPKLDDEKRANMYDRANHFRRNNEFDKAMGIFEQILNEDNTDAEAYWSLVLCRYGIEYVEDPGSRKRLPTVNRAQFTSIFDDNNYKSALQYADTLQKAIYEQEAKAINEIQKGILAISQKEDPFDVFICYKETDNNGRRTHDSVLANDLYHQLTQEGFKVFFSRITLEDKLGSAYEPYIFAALNSAKVMVVLGTKPEYFNAVWVKNEWSRYLSLIKNGEKKMLIPAYRDMDPYDLPEEFSHLQAQDMGKLGFMQDLIRGIKKIIQADKPKETIIKETVIAGVGNNTNIVPLIKRTFLFLEDGDWVNADEYSEKILDIDPECAEAYLAKLMVTFRVSKQEDLKDSAQPFDDDNNYKKAVRFANEELRSSLEGYIEYINVRNENARLESIYIRALNVMNESNTEDSYKKVAKIFESISEYKDSAVLADDCYVKAEATRIRSIYDTAYSTMRSAKDEVSYKEAGNLFESVRNYKDAGDLAQMCYEKAEDVRKDSILLEAKSKMQGDMISTVTSAMELLKSIPGWKDADECIYVCEKKIEEIHAKDFEREQQEKVERKRAQVRAKRNKIIILILSGIACAVVAFIIVLNTVIVPNRKYKDALVLMDNEKYAEAISAFEALDGYKDSEDKIDECNEALLDIKYKDALSLMDKAEYAEAISAFALLNGYKDSEEMITECNTAIIDTKYNEAIALMDEEKFAEAIAVFESIDGYKDSSDKVKACRYNVALNLMSAEKFKEARSVFESLLDYKDSSEKIEQCDVGIYGDKVYSTIPMDTKTVTDILNGKKTIIDFETQVETTLASLPSINDLYVGKPSQYALVDVDGNGVEELIVEFDAMGDRAIILNVSADKCIAYYISFRGYRNIHTDGTADWSNSAAESGIHRIYFTHNGIVSIDLIVANGTDNVYTVNGINVSEEECYEAFSEFDQKKAVEWYDVPELSENQVNSPLEDFILNSDKRYFTKEDLYSFDAEMCRIARNAVYARLGRIFYDDTLTQYFLQFDWYIPTISPENFSEGILNEYQLANRDLVIEYEKEMGWR